MTAPATLVLMGSGMHAAGAPTAQTPLLGLPLVRRAALAAARAGFDRMYVTGGGESEALLRGTIGRPFPVHDAESALPPGRIVLLPDRIAATTPGLRALREAPLEGERVYRLGPGAMVETAQPAELSRILARAPGLDAACEGWAAARSDAGPSPVAAPLVVASREELAEAESLLLKGLVKKEDGLLTRLVSRKISLAVTRRLARTPVTPNAMTLVCLTLGLAAAWSFASPSLPRQVAGGLLFLLHSILDGCDGELARLKFRESRLGGILDFWADNVVHVAVFSAFAFAWSTAVGRSWPLLLGAAAAGSTILSAGFIYFYAMRPRQGGGPLLTTVSPTDRSRLSYVLDTLARRDFIYFVMILALFGKAYWFLAPASVGTPVFFAALLVMALLSRRRQPETATASA